MTFATYVGAWLKKKSILLFLTSSISLDLHTLHAVLPGTIFPLFNMYITSNLFWIMHPTTWVLVLKKFVKNTKNDFWNLSKFQKNTFVIAPFFPLLESTEKCTTRFKEKLPSKLWGPPFYINFFSLLEK